MNRSPDVNLVLREYLADDGIPAPDRVLDAVEQQIARQPRRSARRLPWRPPMNPLFKYGIAAAAVLLIAVVGYNLLPRTASFGGPALTATPPATTAAVATAKPTGTPYICAQDTTGCAGPMPAGTYSSTRFQPKVTFTTQNAWINSEDFINNYELDTGGSEYLLLWSDVVISKHTATCDPVAQAGLGRTVKDWIGFVTTHPGLTATKPEAVNLGDGHGQVVDLTIKDGWTKTCPNFSGTSVQFIMHPDGTHGTYGAASWVHLRLFVLDVGGKTVLVEQYGQSPATGRVVSSMVFTATP